MKLLIAALLLMAHALCADAQFFRYRQDARPREEATAPQFKNGKAGMEKFMKKNYRHPASIDRNISGDIVIDIIVDEKGKVADHRVVRSVNKYYDDEAVRVTKKMKFTPAKAGKKKKVKARHRVTYPIRRGRLSFLDLDTIDI
jgi:TonB family protein